jgi:hypothetical protein
MMVVGSGGFPMRAQLDGSLLWCGVQVCGVV